MKSAYFVIYSDTSKNSIEGLKPKSCWMYEDQIVTTSRFGVEYDESTTLEHSVQRLNSNGRLFRIFPTTEQGASDFMAAAMEYKLNIFAREVVENWKWVSS